MKTIEVTRAEYHEAFMNLDAVLSLEGNWPYKAVWKLRNGKSLAESTQDKNGNNKKYYLYIN